MSPNDASARGLAIRAALAAVLMAAWLYVVGWSGTVTFVAVFAVLYGTVTLAERAGLDRRGVGLLLTVGTAIAGVAALATGAVSPWLASGALVLAALMATVLVLDRHADAAVERPDDPFTVLFEFQIGLGVVQALREQPRSVAELTEELDLTRSRVETAVDRLRRMGFVEKRDETTYALSVD